MKYAFLLSLGLIVGCSSAPKESAVSNAITHPIEIAPKVSHIMSDIEGELLLRLWLHLERQRKWLQGLVDEADTDDKAEASYVLLGEIGQQADATWTIYLSRDE